jgi:ABC-type uncharacterized transport system substrate-binding protein
MTTGTRTSALVVAAASVLIWGVPAGPVAAHPHVWITDVTTFVFEGRQLVGLRHHWTFDEFFGSFLIEEHDGDRDGRFDPAETAALRQDAFDALGEVGYFTQLRIDGDAWPLREVEGFAARIEDGTVVYEFTLLLPQPVDPAAVALAVGMYDPEYYVELLLDEDDPVRFTGLPSGTCTFDIREDTEHPIYYGMVYPLAITLACATT